MKKWFKRTAIWMFAVVALIIMGAVSVSAATYKAQGKCGDQANWTLDNEGNFRVSGKGEMYDYGFGGMDGNVHEKEWGKYRGEIKKVIVSTGITSIGSDAFTYCENLTEVKLPETLKSIGTGAFNGCNSLENIQFPKNLRQIYYYAFGASGLRRVEIPSSISLFDQVFSYCKNLTEAKFDGTWLNANTFQECINLKKVTLGNKVATISVTAFQGCKSLEKIVIPSSVKTIWDGAFLDCTSLREIHFLGEAPEFHIPPYGNGEEEFFKGCGEITAYYPANSKTWNSSNMLNYGAKKVTWVKEGSVATDSISKVTPVIKSVSNGATSLSVKWNKVADATGYQIYRQENSGSWKRVATIKSGSTVSYTDTKVVNGRRYGYRVYATKGSERSKVSKTIYKYFIARNTVTLVKNKSYINIKWKTNSTATGYQVQYAKNSKFSRAKTIKVASRGTASKNLKPGFRGNCYVRVRTYKTVSGVTYYSAWSTTKRITF